MRSSPSSEISSGSSELILSSSTACRKPQYEGITLRYASTIPILPHALNQSCSSAKVS